VLIRRANSMTQVKVFVTKSNKLSPRDKMFT
jgi:hypothetical protein